MEPEGSLPPTFSILSQLDPVHTTQSHFLKIHINIILPSTPGSPQWSLSLRFPHTNSVHDSPFPIRATFPSLLILLDFIIRTLLGEKYLSLSSSYVVFSTPFYSFVLGTNILLNTMFSNTLSLRSSLNISDQVSHPYKTTGTKMKCKLHITKSFLNINW